MICFDCVHCGAESGGEARYDRYGIYAGRLCGKCWQQDSVRTWKHDPGDDEPLESGEEEAWNDGTFSH